MRLGKSVDEISKCSLDEEIYEFCASRYFKLVAQNFPKDSCQGVTLIALSKIAYTSYQLIITALHENRKFLKTDFFKASKKIAKSWKEALKSDLRFLKYRRSIKGHYCVIGFLNEDVKRYVAKKKKTFSYGFVPYNLYAKTSSFFLKDKAIEIFFSQYLDELNGEYNFLKEQDKIFLIYRFQNIVNFYSIYSRKAADYLEKIFDEFLISLAGRSDVRSISAELSRRNKVTIGFPHGNCYLTSFNKTHIVNDTLSICKICLVYCNQHEKDWMMLVDSNNFITIDCRFRNLNDKNFEFKITAKEFSNSKKNVLLVGHPHKNFYWLSLPSYTPQKTIELEEKIISVFLQKGVNVVYKPHPSSNALSEMLQQYSNHHDQPLEDVVDAYEVLVFPHFMSTTFGHCLKLNKEVLCFLENRTPISSSSLKELKDSITIKEIDFRDEKMIRNLDF